MYTFTQRLYRYGLETYPLGNSSVRLYTPEETLCDLLRFSKRLGMEPFLEGLKNYLRARAGHPPQLPRLLEAAQVCGVEVRLKAVLEVLLVGVRLGSV